MGFFFFLQVQIGAHHLPSETAALNKSAPLLCLRCQSLKSSSLPRQRWDWRARRRGPGVGAELQAGTGPLVAPDSQFAQNKRSMPVLKRIHTGVLFSLHGSSSCCQSCVYETLPAKIGQMPPWFWAESLPAGHPGAEPPSEFMTRALTPVSIFVEPLAVLLQSGRSERIIASIQTRRAARGRVALQVKSSRDVNDEAGRFPWALITWLK